MSNNFAQITYNVGIRVGDPTTAFSKIINGYVNQRYKRLFRKFNWQTINPSYTLTTTGVQDYQLPSNLKKALYVYDSTNLLDIPLIDFEELERIYAGALNDTDQAVRCAIYQSLDLNSPPNVIQTLRLYKIPASPIVLEIPYIIGYAPMVNPSDVPIIDCDDACEYGATADAWRTKRQFAKAKDFEGQYEQTIQEMIWEIENNPNRVPQFRPQVYSRDLLYGGDGTSYY